MAGGLEVVPRLLAHAAVEACRRGPRRRRRSISPQGDGGRLRRSGGEALVPVVQAAYLGSSLLSGARMTGWRGTTGLSNRLEGRDGRGRAWHHAVGPSPVVRRRIWVRH